MTMVRYQCFSVLSFVEFFSAVSNHFVLLWLFRIWRVDELWLGRRGRNWNAVLLKIHRPGMFFCVCFVSFFSFVWLYINFVFHFASVSKICGGGSRMLLDLAEWWVGELGLGWGKWNIESAGHDFCLPPWYVIFCYVCFHGFVSICSYLLSFISTG